MDSNMRLSYNRFKEERLEEKCVPSEFFLSTHEKFSNKFSKFYFGANKNGYQIDLVLYENSLPTLNVVDSINVDTQPYMVVGNYKNLQSRPFLQVKSLFKDVLNLINDPQENIRGYELRFSKDGRIKRYRNDAIYGFQLDNSSDLENPNSAAS